MGFWDCAGRVAAVRARFDGRAREAVAVTLSGMDGAAPERRFAMPVETIKIGRDASWADYVLPREQTAASREHLAVIRQASGGWLAVRQEEKYFEVNGQPVEASAPLRSGDVLTLGRKEGPQLRFGIEFGAPGKGWTGFVTQTQDRVIGWQEALCRHGRWVGGGFAAVAVVVAALFGYTVWQDHLLAGEMRAGLEARMARTLTDADGDFSPDKIERLRKAAYTVIECDANPQGPCSGPDGQIAIATAWPVTPTLMVTNAHVGERLARLKSGARMCVRAPATEAGVTPRAYCVKGWRPHEGRMAFRQSVPDMLGVKYNEEFTVSTRPGAYDVALLELEQAVPADTVLPLADPARIESIAAGQPVAFAGYLLRRTEGAAQQHLDPVPQVHFGHVSAITDFFMFSASPANSQLIHNSIPITGGASGSPIIDRDGKVVAIVSSGNVVPVDSKTPGESDLVPSAALVNYAQRADLVRQLLNEGPPFDLAAARIGWETASARFSRHQEYVETTVVELAAEKLGIKVGNPKLEEGFLAKSYSYQVFARDLEAGKSYVALVYSDKPEALQLNIRGVDRCEAASRWPMLFVKVGRDAAAEFVVFGSAKFDRSFSFIFYEAPDADASDSADSSAAAISCID